MNNVPKIMINIILFLGAEQLILAGQQQNPTQTKAQQVKSKVQQAKTSGKSQSAKPSATSKSQASTKSEIPQTSAAKKPSYPVPSHLISDFTKTVNEISEKPTTPEKGATSESKKNYDQKKKEHQDTIEKAYQSYKELYEELKKSETTVTDQQGADIKKAAIKLFNSRNIQNMALPGKVNGSAGKTADSSASKTSSVPVTPVAQTTKPTTPPASVPAVSTSSKAA